MRYSEFWLVYLRAHAKPLTRGLHYVGTLGALGCLLAAVVSSWWVVLLVPLVGYGFAWTGHFGVEGNRPATFGHPFWSFYSDLRMATLALTGRLRHHLTQAGL